MVPSAAMRLWAEERKTGSIELLLTLPVTVCQAVLGKFFAAWCFLGIALLLTFPLPLTVEYLGDPDWGLIVTGYIAAFLMAGGFLRWVFLIGTNKESVVSFILSVVPARVCNRRQSTTLNNLSADGVSGSNQCGGKHSLQIILNPSPVWSSLKIFTYFSF
jgi:ABC-type transport system involved in multi-copper enzyme maturation permease subunit